jgi:hypothetical protein
LSEPLLRLRGVFSGVPIELTSADEKKAPP